MYALAACLSNSFFFITFSCSRLCVVLFGSISIGVNPSFQRY